MKRERERERERKRERETEREKESTSPQFLLQVEMKGISGPIEFKEGRRIQFKLDLLKLKQHSLVKVRHDSPSKIGNVKEKHECNRDENT